MRNKAYTIIFVVSLIIIGANIIDSKLAEYDWYQYETEDGIFSTRILPSQGGKIRSVHERYDHYLNATGSSNKPLFRTQPIYLYKFWKWHRYLGPLYDFPYKANPENKNELLKSN